jgi:hypothetical protein
LSFEKWIFRNDQPVWKDDRRIIAAVSSI